MLKKITFLILLLFCPFWTQAQDTTLIKKVQKLELQIQALTANESVEEREHQSRIKELNQITLNELNNKKYELLWWMLGFVGIGSILGVLTSVWYIPKKIKELTENEINKQVEPLVREKETTIIDLIRKEDKEQQFLSNKKIKIYGEEDETVSLILNKMGFNMNNIKKEDSFKDGEAYAILFINNANGEVLEETFVDGRKIPNHEQLKELEQLINAQADTVCIFYYCGRNIRLAVEKMNLRNNKELLARINFATNPAQIYGNLLNSLKYQHKISQ